MADDLTPVERRRIKSSRRIEETPAEHIAYQHTVLCQTVLPYRDPGDAVRVWQREQGLASLRIEAGAVRDASTRAYIELGLPYGSRPRLILAHLNRQALLHGSPRIEVEHSLTAFIRRIQRGDPNGKEVRRFKTSYPASRLPWFAWPSISPKTEPFRSTRRSSTPSSSGSRRTNAGASSGHPSSSSRPAISTA